MSATNTTKRVRVSKNKKKSWKKFSNVDDVEEYLEDKRLEERLGEDERSRPKFFIEKAGDESLRQDLLNESKSEEKKRKSAPTTADILKDLPGYKAIESTSAIKPCKANVRPTNQAGVPDRLLKKAKNNVRRGKSVKTPEPKPDNKHEFFDIWDEPKVDKDEDKEISELKAIQLVLMRKNEPKVSQYRYQKPSLLPAVPPPPAGTSYNPSFEDHQKLLQDAHKKELQKLKEEAHLKRVLDAYYPTAQDTPLEELWLQEMSAGLETNKDDNEETNEDQNAILEVIPKTTKRKLNSQRRREKAVKEAMEAAKARKEARMREGQIFMLKKLKRKMKEQEEKSKLREEKKRMKEISKMYNPKKLSKHKFQEPDVDLNLSNEISGSLRKVKTEGDLVKDMYLSFQRRNIIETRVPILKKRKTAAKKLYVKKSHAA